ncbi:MAG: 4-hydroxy-tetrahydrodipicolinate synthase [Clostridia bacterium]|jgi:4-hydroxy-tetrahydrodipicolinate synthase|nr:4-hydroxy-tetrahydrodipicolinate synthase [Clostridia bacterium]NLF37435.1 4-hydroxy-tetrahydrodipicolinate synthase [Clostridiaceae bacterium]
MLFKGAATAVITPFNKEGIDFENFDKQIDIQLNCGIQAIIVCGTTGEASTMTEQERYEAISFTVKKVNKKIPVIAGTGCNDTHHSIRLSKDAYTAGADAILVTAPYYNKTSKKGLIEHFRTISESVPIPTILYNIPSRAGMNIDPDVIKHLAENCNVIAIKECNLSQMADVIQSTPDNFTVYSGDDCINLPALSLGAMGVVSVLSNILPSHVAMMNKLFLENKVDQSRELFYKSRKLVNLLFIETSPIPVKKAMHLMGLDSGLLRLPLVDMDEKNAQLLKDEMINQGVI